MLSAALGLDVFYEYRSDLMVLVSLLAILVYGGAIMADIEAQRNRTADDRSPDLPRYSEPDADY